MQSGKEFIEMISDEDYVADEKFYRRIFAQRLSDIRHERGLSRKQLAEGAGVSESFIAECERANRSPKLEKLFALTKFLEISIDDLVGHSLENSRDVLKYRFERALTLVEASGNDFEYDDDGGCSLIILADKEKRDIDDDSNEVVSFVSGKAFVEFMELFEEILLQNNWTFDYTVRDVLENLKDQKISEGNKNNL